MKEEEHLGPDEEIQWDDLRLQQLMKEKVLLREESSMAEEEVKKMEEGIKRNFLDKKVVVIQQDVRDYDDKFGEYHQNLINLMPWIGLRITKGIIDSGVMQVLKLKGDLFQKNLSDSRLKPYTSGTTN